MRPIKDGGARLFSWVKRCETREKTRAFAGELASKLAPGDTLCLEGPMGAGKTTFTKDLAKALGVKDYVTSPTFTLVREYQGRLPLYHFDLFRLENLEDLDFLGFEDYFYGEGVCVIEWPKDFYPLLPENPLKIGIEVTGEESRVFHLSQEGLDPIMERRPYEDIRD